MNYTVDLFITVKVFVKSVKFGRVDDLITEERGITVSQNL